MSDGGVTPVSRLFLLARSSADADVSLAVDRIVRDAGHESRVQGQHGSGATIEGSSDENPPTTIAFVSDDFHGSRQCRDAYHRPLADDPGNERGRLIAFRVADIACPAFLAPTAYVDLVPILAIEDDGSREQTFRDVVLAALGLSQSDAADPYCRPAKHPRPPSLAEAVDFLITESERADLGRTALAPLAEALASDPASLRLAARLLAARPNADPAVYLEALAEHTKPVSDFPHYPASYRAAVLTSFELVEHEPAMRGHAATSLLALAAFAPTPLVASEWLDGSPLSFPDEIRPFIADKALLRSALTLLSDLGLVAWHPSARAFSVYPMLQSVVRDLLVEAGQAEDWRRCGAHLGECRLAPALATGESESHGDRSPRPRAPAPEVARREPENATPKPPAGQPNGTSGPSPEARRDTALAAFETGELHTHKGETNRALAAFETARAIFQDLADAEPQTAQAQADLAATHAKIGLTYAAAGKTDEGLHWLDSCRALIVRLSRREPDSTLWPRYLVSLDAQIADIGATLPPVPPSAVTDRRRTTSACSPQGGETVRRLVQALKEPDDERLPSAADPNGDEEPPPLVIEADRAPPRVFAENGEVPMLLEADAATAGSHRRTSSTGLNGSTRDPGVHLLPETGSLGGAIDPLDPGQPRKTGFLARLFGRRDV
ncbi:MAG: hypothetical protein R3D57_02335 [Hyphomicrobiaceae bacterium]